jgi:hypothetical protein
VFRRGSSDVEALDRSFRSRILLLGLLCVVAIGLATWSGMRDTGRGLAEDPRRVMVIDTASSPGAEDYLRLFEQAGFVVEVEDLAGWEARAREYLADAEEQGLALVLEFADLGGYGFVVIEHPAEFDFAELELELELEPAPDEIEDFAEREFAVLSIGDLAFPHRLTLDDPGEDPRLRVPGHGALQAIYRQPRLAIDRDLLVERPTVDELRLEDAIRFGRQLVDAPLGFSALIDRVVMAETAALAEDGATTLVEPLHTGSSLPIAGGGALLLHHELIVYSDDARTLEIDSAERLTISWQSPEALASGDLGLAVPCTDLLGGEIRLDRRPSFEVSRDGRRIAITTEREGSRVWRKLDEPGCRFVELGELPEREPGEAYFGELAPEVQTTAALVDSPVLARIGQTDRGARLRLWTVREGAEWAPSEHGLLELPELELRVPTFLDGHRIALLSRSPIASDATEPPPPIDALHVVDARRPASDLRIPAAFIGEGLRLRELAWLPPSDPAAPWNLHVLVTTLDATGHVRVVELALTDEVAALVDAGLATPGPELEALAPGDLVVHTIVERDDLLGLAVAPSGRWLALVVGDPLGKDSELALFDRSTGTLDRLTINDLRDYLPRFTHDGRQIVFSSLMQVWISGRTFTVPRVIATPP